METEKELDQKRLVHIQEAIIVDDFILAKFLSTLLETSYGKEKYRELIKYDEIQKACKTYNFNLAEILLTKLNNSEAKHKARDLIDSAKSRQKEKIRRDQIDNLIVQIQKACNLYDFELAKKLSEMLENANDLQKAEILIESAKSHLEEEIRDSCRIYNFELAEKLIAKLDNADAKQNSRNLINSAKIKHETEIKKKYIDSSKEKIIDYLKVFDFGRAASLYSEIEADYPQEQYSNLVRLHRKKQEKEDFIFRLYQVFRSGDFLHAEALYLASNLITHEEYYDIKAKSISEITEKKYSQSLYMEQAYALVETSTNTLVKARAGSGKTRIIVTKTALMLDFFDVDLNELIVLAFNKKAAHEINKRMQESYNKPMFSNASTFHSLAYRIVNQKLDILSDPSEDSKGVTQTKFVQNTLRKVLQNEQQLSNAYQFLRTEIEEIENKGLLLNEKEYYLFQRGSPQFSLRGEKVFSELEKIIADYLFEHGVDYKYLKGFKIRHGYFRPSFFFTSNDQMLIIETWEHFDSRLDSNVSCSREDVSLGLKSMCEEESIRLLELTKREVIDLSRKEVESILSGLLRKNGLVLTKFPVEYLYSKVFENPNVITRLATLCTQFIQRSKKLSIYPDDLIQKIAAYTPIDKRESGFHELIGHVYTNYEKGKKEAGKIDFDDLLLMAIKNVGVLSSDATIQLSKSSSRSLHLNQIKWILIDEYQDFSELFCRLISEIKLINNDVKMFCVGDDWQAINGFAGSDLKFFNDFDSLNINSKSVELVKNHRSEAKIVNLGNKLMYGLGAEGEALPENNTGQVKLFAIEDIQLVSTQKMHNGESSNESIFYCYKRYRGNKTCQISTSKYLRLVHAIATSPEFIGKKVAILSRTNEIYGVDNSNFISNLNRWLRSSKNEEIQNQTDFVEISTIHSYKGREADVVILLEVTSSKFPLLHPDNYLQNILGRTCHDVFDEERRLLYVGITRAKSALFLVTEKSRISPFVKQDLKLEFDDPYLTFPDLRVRNPNIPDYQDNRD